MMQRLSRADATPVFAWPLVPGLCFLQPVLNKILQSYAELLMGV
jgi:hypothetical protein